MYPLEIKKEDSKIERRLKGALLLVAIFLGALMFIGTHDYLLNVEYNKLVKDYNDLKEDCIIIEEKEIEQKVVDHIGWGDLDRREENY
jgi:hypothetical protein